MELPYVLEVVVPAGGPSTFVLGRNASERERVLTSSVLVQETLASALVTGAEVEIELVPGSSVVRRVHPIEVGNGCIASGPGEYLVSRIATQRTPEGREHLEAFLKKGGSDTDKAYNLYAPMLQQILNAAFMAVPGNTPVPCPPLYVEFDGDAIATVRLGKS